MDNLMQTLTSLIGPDPKNYIEVVNENVKTVYVVYDTGYILRAVLLVMTVFTIYGILINLTRGVGDGISNFRRRRR